jgi:hypothetical protein
MANNPPNSQQISNLKAENRRLKEENERLRELAGTESVQKAKSGTGIIRKTGVIIFMALAVLLLIAGNLFFWAGNTIVKTDRYTDAVEPLISNAEIQSAISSYTTQQLFNSVDVEALTQDVLPPRAEFLAPSISAQLESNTDTVVKGILARPQFQDKWNTAQANAHSRFISAVEQHGSDGSLDISEFYNEISAELKNTRLSFLANKPLPQKVGSIQVISGSWLSSLQTLISNIDTWRTIALIMLLFFSFLAIWFSRKKRQVVIVLGLLFATGMFATLLVIRAAREIIAGKVDAQYSEAASQAAQTLFHPLALQTATILVFGLLVSFVAWVSGPSRGARSITNIVRGLLSGKLHAVLFSKENKFTLWMDQYKTVLQWCSVGLVALSILFIRLTPKSLLLSAIAILIAILLIEVLSAKPSNIK